MKIHKTNPIRNIYYYCFKRCIITIVILISFDPRHKKIQGSKTEREFDIHVQITISIIFQIK